MTDETPKDRPSHEDEDFVTNTHFAKLYASILSSSVWEEDPTTRIVWVTLLLMCDKDGHVEASDPGIYRMANVTPAQGKEALRILAEPDVNSKSKEWGGRRIERVGRGWKILNYEKYRNAQTPTQRAAAERQARARAKRQFEAEWRKAHVGQELPADWDDNWEALRHAAVTASNAQREKEREKERERETQFSSSTSSSGENPNVENPVEEVDNSDGGALRRVTDFVLEALESDLDREAFRDILAASGNPYAWASECRVRLQGMHPPMLTPRQLGEALRDYWGNGHTKNPSFKHFRKFLSRLDAPESPPAGNGQAGTLGQGGNGAVGEAGAILARLKGGSLVGEPLDVRQALEALGGLAAVRECKPDRWGFLVKDFVDHLAFARANPRPELPAPPQPAPPAPRDAEESPAMRRAREREEAWLAEHPGEPLPKDFHLKPPPKPPEKGGSTDTPRR